MPCKFFNFYNKDISLILKFLPHTPSILKSFPFYGQIKEKMLFVFVESKITKAKFYNIDFEIRLQDLRKELMKMKLGQYSIIPLSVQIGDLILN